MKKNDEQKYTDEQFEELQQNALNLQTTAQNVENQLVQHQQLCAHYEQTINILTGRLQEAQQLVSQLRQQLQTRTEE
tara:strand:+ start:64 stop:294 length:231 start_codon:yes stop_codon:yes gene_type:complete